MDYIEFYESRYPIKVHNSSARSIDKIHMHGYLQIFCVKEGTCIHDLFGNAGKIYPGEISIAPPFSAHRTDGRSEDYQMFGMDADGSFFKNSRQFRTWNFYDSCLQPLCSTVSKKGHILRPERDVSTDVFKLYDEIKETSKNENTDKLALLRGKTIELISLIATEYSLREYSLNGNGASGNCAPMHEVFKFVHNNFNREISPEQIAKEAMISERSLYRLFEESMNMSVHQYIQYLRLNHSKELLRNTDRTIRDIANDAGFVYLANFHRFFRAKEGKSPSEYREEFRCFAK